MSDPLDEFSEAMDVARERDAALLPYMQLLVHAGVAPHAAARLAYELHGAATGFETAVDSHLQTADFQFPARKRKPGKLVLIGLAKEDIQQILDSL